MMLLDFPYTVNDEPTEAWTVEQVLHWWLLRAQSETQASFDDMEDRLRTELEKGKAVIWKDHQQVSDALHNENSNPQQPEELSKPVQKEPLSKPTASREAPTASRSTRQTKTRANTRGATNKEEPVLDKDTIRIDVIQGEYKGMFYLLQPSGRNNAWVGRSQGKRFREKGISLPKDLEVSTTHGKFELRRGTFYFRDDASTNGSLINGEKIDAQVEIPLVTGTEITVGQTIMKVTLPN